MFFCNLYADKTGVSGHQISVTWKIHSLCAGAPRRPLAKYRDREKAERRMTTPDLSRVVYKFYVHFYQLM